jgi:hypothetical protein
VRAIVGALPAGRSQTLAGQAHAVEPDALAAFYAA